MLALGAVAVVRYLPLALAAAETRDAAERLATTLADAGPEIVVTGGTAALRADADAILRGSARLGDALRGDPLAGLVRLLPGGAAQVDGAVALTDAAAAAAEAALLALDLAGIIEQESAAADPLPALVRAVAASEPDALRAAELLGRAAAAAASVPATAAGPLRSTAERVASLAVRAEPLVRSWASIAGALPAIAGIEGERRYLLLAQNPAEIRPTGGFIGTYGIVTLRDGGLAGVTVDDVYRLDGQPGLPRQEPPPALAARLLGRGSWELADANWSPHFPEAAADALRLYGAESGDDRIDGVIALGTGAIDRLLRVTGPLTLPESGIVVRAGETLPVILGATRTEGTDRKAPIAELAEVLLARLLALPAADRAGLVRELPGLVRSRDLQAWLVRPAEQALLAGTPLAGELLAGPGDHVDLVDANVAPSSKLSPVVERAWMLSAALGADGSVEHALRTTWRNRGDADDPLTRLLRAASESEEGLYGLYVRLLVPGGSELLALEGMSRLPVSGVEETTTIAGRTAWGSYLLIPPGEAWLAHAWRTPAVVLAEGEGRLYRLSLRKQPGMGPEPVTIAIRLPAGVRPASLSPGLVAEGETVRWSGTLTEDLVLELRWLP